MVLINTLPGFEKFEGYGITSCGKVWSFKTNKFLSLSTDEKGYYNVNLTNGRQEQKAVRVHRLVALAYIPNPNNYDTVDHIDEIKSHNYINNLRWMSRGDNKKRSWSKKVICIDTGEIFESGVAAARKYGLYASKISNVCNGKRKTTGGLRFKFLEDN